MDFDYAVRWRRFLLTAVALLSWHWFATLPAHANALVTEADLHAANLPQHSSHKKQVLYAASLAERLTPATDPNIILDTIALQIGAWIDIGFADKLEALLDAVERLAKHRGDAMRIGTMAHLRARTNYFLGNEKRAVDDAQRALEAQRRIGAAAREHPDPTRLFQQTIEFAFMLQGTGRDADLVTELRAAERLVPRLRDLDRNKIALDYLFSSLRLALGDRVAALSHLDAALTSATMVGDQGWIGEILGARSTLYLDAGEAAKAIDTARQYRALAQQEDHRLAEANAELSLAEAYMLLNEPARAYTAGARAVALFDTLDDNFMKADARRELARAAASLGNSGEAESLLREALQRRPEATSLYWSHRIARVRTAIAIANGDLRAIKRAKDEEDKRDLLRQIEHSAAQTRALREFHEVNARELQLQLLQRERDNRELEIQRGTAQILYQRVALGAGAALLAGALCAMLLLYRRSRILRKAADTDTLTGAKSRGAILAFAQSLWSNPRTEHRTVAACVVDIDHFKRFNDEYGHATGDEVLTRCVEIIRRNLRPQDAVGRIGGDEFLIVMVNVNEDQALATARRIVEAVRTEVLARDDEGELRASISAGVAAMTPSPQSSSKQLVQRADAALIDAKNAGKDQVLAFAARAAAAA